jgi:hypothetical protein
MMLQANIKASSHSRAVDFLTPSFFFEMNGIFMAGKVLPV